MTFHELTKVYFADPEKAGLRSIHEVERRIGKDALPLIGDIKLTKLVRRDVRDVIEAIAKRGASRQAFLTFKDVQAVLRWAVRKEYLERIRSMAWRSRRAARPRNVLCPTMKSKLYGVN